MFKNILLFLSLIISSLFASDVITDYRFNGLNNLEKKMDLELTKTDYWASYIKEYDTTFGFIENYSAILTCNKEKSKLSLYKHNKDKKFTFVKDYGAFTGEIKGSKTQEGDLKTPVGIYNLTKRISELDSFYGPLAFVTSYPNEYDKLKGRNGHGIWIHGLPTEEEREDFTKGCIAIDNDNIECLDRNINFNNTLLIINKTDVSHDISKEKLALLLSNLYKWRYAWLYSDIHSYLEFYADDFIRFDGMKYKEFKRYKTRVFKQHGKKTIIFNNISVVPYPDTTDIYQITFEETYRSPTFRFKGGKSLMVKIVNNKMKIFTER